MNTWLDEVKFDQNGLIPAIAQDQQTGRVLMVAWMNRNALQQTFSRKQAVYFSRSRQKLWHKGEQSGHYQTVHQIQLDCDADVIVLIVTQHGGIACHTGRQSCFFRKLDAQGQWQTTEDVLKDPATIYQDKAAANADLEAKNNNELEQTAQPELAQQQSIQEQSQVLAALDQIMQQRKGAAADSSYIASLYHKGINKILEKVGEEATETIIAAKDLSQQPEQAQLRQDLIGEVADVWFHSLVALAHFDLSSDDILAELSKRQGLSGLVEKANRDKT